MSLHDDLVAAKARYLAHRSDGMWQAVARGVPEKKLEALSFLRQHLPKRFRDFAEFERSHAFSRNEAIRTFDRAIAAATEAAS